MAPTALLRRLITFVVAWVLSAAFYLLLIDTPSLPELLVGAGAAILAAAGLVLAAEQNVLEAGFRGGWLRKAWRPIAKVPTDIAAVSWTALAQLISRKPSQGEFRTVEFRGDESNRIETGRQALAESMGSFAPNTIIVGVDEESQSILGHQLRRTGGPEAIDVLELG